MFYVFVTLNRGRSIALSAGCLFKYTTLNLCLFKNTLQYLYAG